MVQLASSASKSNGLPVPAFQASKPACTSPCCGLHLGLALGHGSISGRLDESEGEKSDDDAMDDGHRGLGKWG